MRTFSISGVVILAVVACTFLSQPTSGAILISANNRASFVAAIGDPTVEDFQSFTTTLNYPYNTPQVLGNITVTANGSSDYLTDFRMVGYEPPVGGRELEMWVNRYDPAIQSFTINLGRPVTAFGADFNVNNTALWPSVHFIVDGSDLQPPVLSYANTQFVGITSTTPFQIITLTTNPGGFYYTQMDNVVFGAVPEPASALLLVTGALLFLSRRLTPSRF